MSTYVFSDCPCYANNVLIFANNIKINSQNQLEAQYVTNSPNAINTVAGGGMRTDIEIGFFPSYLDIFYQGISNNSGIDLNIGGMIFTGCYVSSFNLQGNYGSPVQGQAKLSFFREFDNSFLPSPFIKASGNLVDDSDWRIAHSNLIQSINSLSVQNLLNFSYTYNKEIFPRYSIGSDQCDRIYFGKGRINSTLAGEQLQNFVTTSGNAGLLSFSLADICGNPLNAIRYIDHDDVESNPDTVYQISGFVSALDAEINPNDIIKGTIDLVQYL